MIRSNLRDYGDAYIIFSRTITVTGEGENDAAKRADKRNKGVIFKNCAPLHDCIYNIKNTQTDTENYIDVVVSMYNLIERSGNYSKTSESSW